MAVMTPGLNNRRMMVMTPGLNNRRMKVMTPGLSGYDLCFSPACIKEALRVHSE